VRRKEAIENRVWPDGLAHHSNGQKVYTPDGQVVSGVNSYSERKTDPKTKKVNKSEPDVETIKEEEDHAEDIADAKNAFPKVAK
jgi:hypothetical protein